MFVFFSIFSSGRLIEAFVLPRIVQNIAIFSVEIGGWAFIRAWASIRDFTVSRIWFHEKHYAISFLLSLLHNCCCLIVHEERLVKIHNIYMFLFCLRLYILVNNF